MICIFVVNEIVKVVNGIHVKKVINYVQENIWVIDERE